MSAPSVVTPVTEMPCVQILKEVSPVPATLDSLVMECHAVSVAANTKHNVYYCDNLLCSV